MERRTARAPAMEPEAGTWSAAAGRATKRANAATPAGPRRTPAGPRPPPRNPRPRAYPRAGVGVVRGGGMIGTAAPQVPGSFRTPARLALTSLAVDAVAVMGTLALYAFDPRGNLLILIPAIQAEAGVVLGLTWGLAYWGATSFGYVAIEILSRSLSGVQVSAVDVALRIMVGAVLTMGGGILRGELSEERQRALEEREKELQHLKALVGRLKAAEERYRVLVEQTPALLYIDMPD